MAKQGKVQIDIDVNSKEAEKQAQSFGAKLKSALTGMAAPLLAVQAGFNMVMGAIRGVISVTSQFVNAAVESARANINLESSLKRIGITSVEANKDLQDFADTMQRSTIFDDEQIKNAMAFGLSLNIPISKIKEFTKAAMNLSAGATIDLQTAMRAMAQATAGNVGQLSRYIGKLKEGEDPIKKATEMFIGKAEALDKADRGIGQLKKSWGEFSETLGAIIIENIEPMIRNIIKLTDIITEMLKTIRGEAKNTNEELRNFYGIIAASGATTMTAVKNYAGYFKIDIPTIEKFKSKTDNKLFDLEAFKKYVDALKDSIKPLKDIDKITTNIKEQELKIAELSGDKEKYVKLLLDNLIAIEKKQMNLVQGSEKWNELEIERLELINKINGLREKEGKTLTERNIIQSKAVELGKKYAEYIEKQNKNLEKQKEDLKDIYDSLKSFATELISTNEETEEVLTKLIAYIEALGSGDLTKILLTFIDLLKYATENLTSLEEIYEGLVGNIKTITSTMPTTELNKAKLAYAEITNNLKLQETVIKDLIRDYEKQLSLIDEGTVAWYEMADNVEIYKNKLNDVTTELEKQTAELKKQNDLRISQYSEKFSTVDKLIELAKLTGKPVDYMDQKVTLDDLYNIKKANIKSEISKMSKLGLGTSNEMLDLQILLAQMEKGPSEILKSQKDLYLERTKSSQQKLNEINNELTELKNYTNMIEVLKNMGIDATGENYYTKLNKILDLEEQRLNIQKEMTSEFKEQQSILTDTLKTQIAQGLLDPENIRNVMYMQKELQRGGYSGAGLYEAISGLGVENRSIANTRIHSGNNIVNVYEATPDQAFESMNNMINKEM